MASTNSNIRLQGVGAENRYTENSIFTFIQDILHFQIFVGNLIITLFQVPDSENLIIIRFH